MKNLNHGSCFFGVHLESEKWFRFQGKNVTPYCIILNTNNMPNANEYIDEQRLGSIDSNEYKKIFRLYFVLDVTFEKFDGKSFYGFNMIGNGTLVGAGTHRRR